MEWSLVLLGINCLRAADCVLAERNFSTTELTAFPNSPDCEIGASSKNTFSFSRISVRFSHKSGSHITLQPKTGCPLKLSRVEPGQYLDGRPPEKTRLLLEEVLVRPAGGAHPVVCVGPNAPV